MVKEKHIHTSLMQAGRTTNLLWDCCYTIMLRGIYAYTIKKKYDCTPTTAQQMHELHCTM